MSDKIWLDFIDNFFRSVKEWEENKELYQSLHIQLQQLLKMVTDGVRRELSNDILECLLTIVKGRQPNELLVECLRILRNLVGQIPDQELPIVWEPILQESMRLVKEIMSLGSLEGNIIQAHVALQFISNFLNHEPQRSYLIWEGLHYSFRELLVCSDGKVVLFTSSIIYGLLRNSQIIIEEIVKNKESDNIAERLIVSSHNGVIYAQFSIQHFMKEPNLLEMLYANQNDLNIRLQLLHQIAEFLPTAEINVNNWRYLSQLFKDRSNLILNTCESSAVNLEALEAASLVEILAKGSSNDVCRNEFRLDDSLLETCVHLLRSIHSLGKAGSNYFSTVPDHFEAVDHHPALNFKGNLVRLLGNLCYRNVDFQDRARNLEAIPPLLECSNLDARNPFIQQWSVLAIRNLCEGNTTNQNIISSLTRTGVVQSPALDNLGLVVEESADGLSIRSSNKSDI